MDKAAKSLLDPRTKIFTGILATVNVFVLIAFAENSIGILFVALYGVLFLLEGKYQAFFNLASSYITLFIVVYFIFPHLPELIAIIFSLFIYALRLFPAAAGMVYIVQTTRVGEISAVFRKMHIKDSLSIVFIVVLRFFPAVNEEQQKIRAAMKLRNIHGIGNRFEYIYVPLLNSISETAEELGDSIVARGIENPCKKTSYREIGFKLGDILVIFASVVIFLVEFLWK